MSMSLFRHVHSHRAKRPLAALATAAAVAALAVPPASADASQVYLYAGLNNSAAVPANGVPTEIDVQVGAYDVSGSTTSVAHDVVLTVAFAAGGPVTGTTSYSGCTTAATATTGTTVTCQIPSVATSYSDQIVVPFMVAAASGTPNGTDAGMTVGVTASDAVASGPYPQPLTVADGPNLVVASQNAPLLNLPRGKRTPMPQMTVTNTGTQPALGATIRFLSNYYTPLTGNFSNCRTRTDDGEMVCFVDTVIQPGETYQVANPAGFRLRTDTVVTLPGQMVDSPQESITPGDDVAAVEGGQTFTAGTGKPLTLLRTVGTGTVQTTTQSVA